MSTREIRECACGCGYEKVVTTTSKWKVAKGHGLSEKISSLYPRKVAFTKFYPSNPKFSKEELTGLVKKYKSSTTSSTERHAILGKIVKFLRDITHDYLVHYNIYRKFPPSISEEVFLDCQSVILLKAIDSFNWECSCGHPANTSGDYRGKTCPKCGEHLNCSRNFSTWYVNKLRSYLSERYEYHSRRLPLYNTISLSNSHLSISDDASDYSNPEECIETPTYTKYADQEVKVFCKEIVDIHNNTMTKVGARVPNFNKKKRLSRERVSNYLQDDFEVGLIDKLRGFNLSMSQVSSIMNTEAMRKKLGV